MTRGLFGRWPIVNIVLGVTLASFTGYGAGQFAGPYFVREFGLDYATVGLILGMIAGVSGGLGTLAGGFIGDWAGRRGGRWYALVPAIGLAIAAPIYILGYRQPDWRTAAAVLLVPGIFAYTYLGPTFAVVQNAFPARRRATAAAILFLFLNIIALGGGPLFTGWIIDAFAAFNFAHPGHAHVLEGLASLGRARRFGLRAPLPGRRRSPPERPPPSPAGATPPSPPPPARVSSSPSPS